MRKVVALVLAIMFITVSACAEEIVKGGGFYYVNNLVGGGYGQIYMSVHYLKKENGYYQDKGNTCFWVDEAHYEFLNHLTQQEFIKWDEERSYHFTTEDGERVYPVFSTAGGIGFDEIEVRLKKLEVRIEELEKKIEEKDIIVEYRNLDPSDFQKDWIIDPDGKLVPNIDSMPWGRE